MMQRKINSLLLGASCALFCIFFTSLCKVVYLDFERKTYDLRFLLKERGGETEIENPLIIDIDEKSLDRLGRFQSWPRIYHAEVIDYVNSGGARIVGLDILFPESDKIPEEAIRLFRDKKIKGRYVKAVLERYTFDEDLARVVKRWGNVYLAFHFPDRSGKAGSSNLIERFSYSFHYPFLQKSVILPPCDQLACAASGIGFINLEPDPDGVIRSHPLFLQHYGRSYPCLGLEIARCVLDIEQKEVRISRDGSILLGDRRIPIDKHGRMLINYIGAHRTFARVSYSDVLLKRIPKDYFKDKIVLIGTSALGLGDLRATPLSHSSPGVEIHATVLHNILNGEFIIRTRWFTTLGLILFLSVFISVISSSVRPIPSIVTTLAIICAFLFSAYLLFTYRNVWIEVVRPVYAIFFSYVVTGVQRYVGEESLKRRIKGMFSRFVPEGVVSRLVEERSQDILLSGKKEDLTVLISDIRDFTSMSHRMEPEKVVSMLNRYFSAMTDVIFRHGGTIDKFMGDSVMAIFGAPVPLKDHAFMATKAALEMKKSMAELNRQWMLSGGARLDIGIGINTGEMIVGFVGSETRLDYTVIGDNVNIAARLEPLSRKYNTTIIIGPKTYERIKDRAIVKDLGKIKLRGIEERLSIYAVLDVKTG